MCPRWAPRAVPCVRSHNAGAGRGSCGHCHSLWEDTAGQGAAGSHAELDLRAGTVELQAPHVPRTAVGTQRALRKASQCGSVWVWMEPRGACRDLGRRQQ